MKRFYQTGNVWTVGEYDAVPAGSCFEMINTTSGWITVTMIGLSSNSIIVQGKYNEFMDANGVAYASLEAFKTATDSFFVKATGDGGATLTQFTTLLADTDYIYNPPANPKSVQVYDAEGNQLGIKKLIASPYTITVPTQGVAINIEINLIF